MLKFLHGRICALQLHSSSFFSVFAVYGYLFFTFLFARPYRIFRIAISKNMGFRSFVHFRFYNLYHVRSASNLISLIKRGSLVFKTLEFARVLAYFRYCYFIIRFPISFYKGIFPLRFPYGC